MDEKEIEALLIKNDTQAWIDAYFLRAKQTILLTMKGHPSGGCGVRAEAYLCLLARLRLVDALEVLPRRAMARSTMQNVTTCFTLPPMDSSLAT